MNRWGWILALGVGLVLGALGFSQGEREAYAAAGDGASSDLEVVSVATPTGNNLVVVDRQQKVIAVYRIDENGTAIHLRSVRDIRWDLMLEEFNPTSPRPAEVRAMLERR